MKSWTVLEWSELPYGSGPDRIPAGIADRVASAARVSPLFGHTEGIVFEHGRASLRTKQIVGVVAAEGYTLEILPKIIELGDAKIAADIQDIRTRLIGMLSVAENIKISVGEVASLGWQNYDLLELLIAIFANKLVDSVRLGLPRRYVDASADLGVLRGRLDVKRQFTNLAVMPHRIACEFTELSPNIALNQIMKAAVRRLRRLAKSDTTQRLLAELAFAYDEVSDVETNKLNWGGVFLDRTNSQWTELVELARLLIAGKYQTASLGDSQGYSLLFDMNRLFEAYIAKLIPKAVANTHLKFAVQGGGLYCLTERTGALDQGPQRFQTKLDVLIKDDSKNLLVIDTKWKVLKPRQADTKYGISQDDIYQMMAYAQVYQCQSLVLLYPHYKDLGKNSGIQVSYTFDHGRKKLFVATIDVSMSHEKVIYQLGALLAETLAMDVSGPSALNAGKLGDLGVESHLPSSANLSVSKV